MLAEQVYEIGLDQFQGDTEKALEFTEGFFKEAGAGEAVAKTFGGLFMEGAAKTLAGVAVGVGSSLAIHGMSSALRNTANDNLRAKFEVALVQAVKSSDVLKGANPAKIRSYAESIFNIAPRIAGDPNMLANVLAGAVDGESIDINTVRTLADLENRVNENRKNALFSPKEYVK